MTKADFQAPRRRRAATPSSSSRAAAAPARRSSPIFTYDDYREQMRAGAEGLYAAGLDPLSDRCMNLFFSGGLYGGFLSIFSVLEELRAVQFPMAAVMDFPAVARADRREPGQRPARHAVVSRPAVRGRRESPRALPRREEGLLRRRALQRRPAPASARALRRRVDQVRRLRQRRHRPARLPMRRVRGLGPPSAPAPAVPGDRRPRARTGPPRPARSGASSSRRWRGAARRSRATIWATSGTGSRAVPLRARLAPLPPPGAQRRRRPRGPMFLNYRTFAAS